MARIRGIFLAEISILPSRAGKFVISLDCEGKWGMADKIGPFHDRYITHEGLIAAYNTLCDLFKSYDMPATFAFVMAFVLDEQGRSKFGNYFCDDEIEGKSWLRHFRKAEAMHNVDGWFCPEALEIVRSSGNHEIAAHGFSHIPLGENHVPRHVAERELKGCTEVAEHLGINLRTFVYPRNDIGHVSVLADAGIAGYREAPRKLNNVPARLSNLVSEANIFTRAESSLANHTTGVRRIPGGYMVNWQHGARRIVPSIVSSIRWSSILADAAENGKIAHLWLHPHNILTAPRTLDRVHTILAGARRWRDRGRLDVVTQDQLIG